MSPAQLPAGLPPENITVDPLETHCELFNAATGDVWLCQAPLSPEQYKALKVEAPFMKSGMGRSAMDIAWFRRSPGAEVDGPLETREIGGLRWSRVARPRNFRGFKPGDAPTHITVEKHHSLGWHSGRRVELMRLPDGHYYVQQTAAVDGGVTPTPAGWTRHELILEAPWIVALANPAEVYFFRNLRSFVGPLTAAELPGTPQPRD